MDLNTAAIGTADQQCRTCTHSKNRTWNANREEIQAASTAEEFDALKCQPEHHNVTFRIRRDGALVQLNESPHVINTTDLGISGPREPVFADSCGWKITAKCTQCARFRGTVMRIPHDKWENSMRDVVIMGACSIPDEGIVDPKTGRTVTCLPMPKRKRMNIQPSCENCRYRMSTDERWQNDPFDVVDSDLTPYEMDQVRLRSDPTRVGLAIYHARQAKNLSASGRKRWYSAVLNEQRKDGNKLLSVVATMDNGTTAEFFFDGDEITHYVVSYELLGIETKVELPPEACVYHVCQGDKIAFEIKLPYQKELGYINGPRNTDGATKRARVMPALPPQETERRWDDDYWGSRNVTYSSVSDNYEFHPSAIAPIADHGQRHLWIHHSPTGPVVVDEAMCFHNMLKVWLGAADPTYDERPHPTMFRLRLRSFLDAARQRYGVPGYMAVLKQYLDILGDVKLGKPTLTSPNITRSVSLEPFKEYCAAHLANPSLGIDLRELFGDTFGMDRTEYSRTWSYEMGKDEWFRSTQAGNELHVEMTKSDSMRPSWPNIHDDDDLEEYDFDVTKVTTLDMFGKEVENFNNQQITDYKEWLDERVDRVSELGHITQESRRMQVHGYELYSGSRTEKVPNIAFSTDGESIDAKLYCNECDNSYELTEISGADLICPSCGADLFYGRTGAEPSTWVRMGKRLGIGNAIASDSQAYQDRRKLRTTVCESWKFRYNPSIGLDRVLPPTTKGAENLGARIDKALQEVIDIERQGIDVRFIGGTTTGGYRTETAVTIRSKESAHS